jgi:hypothetical protein
MRPPSSLPSPHGPARTLRTRQWPLPGSYGPLREVPPSKGSNIGRAKRSKLLHLKRSWLVPIADTRVISVYHRQADSWAARLGIPDGHWEAVREDLTAGTNDFKRLTTRLCDDQEPAVRRLGQLTNLRLLDILAWMISDS